MDYESWICDFSSDDRAKIIAQKAQVPTLPLYKVITADLSQLIPVKMENENMTVFANKRCVSTLRSTQMGLNSPPMDQNTFLILFFVS